MFTFSWKPLFLLVGNKEVNSPVNIKQAWLCDKPREVGLKSERGGADAN